MGNHEANAVAWNLGDANGHPLRPHTPAHRKQHAAHLSDAARDPWSYHRHIAFYASLPVFLDFGDFRCIHAYWDKPVIGLLSDQLDPDRVLTDAQWPEAYTAGHPLSAALQLSLNGPRVKLPKPLRYRGSDGTIRKTAALHWWLQADTDVSKAVVLSAPVKARKPLRGTPLRAHAGYTSDIPVFFGHYHLKTAPRVTAQNAVCTDFGAGSNRRLAAFRYSGQSRLRDTDFTSVRVTQT